jgi:hypothetical protein
MKMIEVKTADLTRRALDYAVAVVEGHPLCEECCSGTYALIIGTGRGDLKEFSPSTDWRQGGPLIDKYQIGLLSPAQSPCSEWHASAMHPDLTDYTHPVSPLIAACRAIVGAKLGEVVKVPKELMP